VAGAYVEECTVAGTAQLTCPWTQRQVAQTALQWPRFGSIVAPRRDLLFTRPGSDSC
jgi:hypothetical protein